MALAPITLKPTSGNLECIKLKQMDEPLSMCFSDAAGGHVTHDTVESGSVLHFTIENVHALRLVSPAATISDFWQLVCCKARLCPANASLVVCGITQPMTPKLAFEIEKLCTLRQLVCTEKVIKSLKKLQEATLSRELIMTALLLVFGRTHESYYPVGLEVVHVQAEQGDYVTVKHITATPVDVMGMRLRADNALANKAEINVLVQDRAVAVEINTQLLLNSAIYKRVCAWLATRDKGIVSRVVNAIISAPYAIFANSAGQKRKAT